MDSFFLFSWIILISKSHIWDPSEPASRGNNVRALVSLIVGSVEVIHNSFNKQQFYVKEKAHCTFYIAGRETKVINEPFK